MRNTTIWLQIALGGAFLAVYSLFGDFYVYDERTRTAWFGIAHTSEMILLAAIFVIVLFVLTALGRAPFGGRRVGQIIGTAALIATAQLGYRMAAPPFGATVPEHADIFGSSCLYYCLPSQANAAILLPGIWLALAGCIAMSLGGLAHASTENAFATPANIYKATEQPGLSPWLRFAGVGAIGQFLFGYTIFTFYTTVGSRGVTTWSGWLPSPHTGWLVLMSSIAIIGLLWTAQKRMSPLRPIRLGGVIAVLGLLSASRIAYRIFKPPFSSSTAEIGFAAYLALLSGVIIVVGALIHLATAARKTPQNPSRVTQEDF